MLRNKKGFTLIELMVVAIIVAILAAVAIPLMRGSEDRAIATEAEAALGSIRTAMRAVFAEYGGYNTGTGNPLISLTPGDDVVGNVPGFRARAGTTQGDLDGTYFSENCYTIETIGADTFTAQCDWSISTSPSGTGLVPRAVQAVNAGHNTVIDAQGTITRTGY